MSRRTLEGFCICAIAVGWIFTMNGYRRLTEQVMELTQSNKEMIVEIRYLREKDIQKESVCLLNEVY